MQSPPVYTVEIYTFQIFQMHNSFIWSLTVLPERKREKKRGREKSCRDEVLHESVPGQRPAPWRHRDEDLILPSTIFPFPLFFYSRRRTSSYTQSWMGKHKVSSNVLQLNTVKKKGGSGTNTSARAFQRKWERNGKGEEALFWGYVNF